MSLNTTQMQFLLSGGPPGVGGFGVTDKGAKKTNAVNSRVLANQESMARRR